MGFPSMAISYICFSVLHLLCFIFGLTVCGLYGVDLHHANQKGVYSDSKWVYAVVVGAFSAVTALVYMIPMVLRVAGIFAVAWDFVLFILWAAVFGVFGKLYIHEKPEGVSGIKRMKNAVWIDLINMLLWLIAACASLGYWWKHRDSRSKFTGRAHV